MIFIYIYIYICTDITVNHYLQFKMCSHILVDETRVNAIVPSQRMNAMSISVLLAQVSSDELGGSPSDAATETCYRSATDLDMWTMVLDTKSIPFWANITGPCGSYR